MVEKKDAERMPPDFFLADPPPPQGTPLTPLQYRADVKYNKSQAIVLDMGTSALRAGYSACASPTMQIPPYVARMRDPDTGLRTFLIGHEALISSARSTARPAYDSAIPNNPALMERLLDGTLATLGLSDEEKINHRFVLTEAPCQPNSARALMMELLFEAYEAPGICFGVDALFSYFYNRSRTGATPKETMRFAKDDAVVVSCGYNATHVLPILSGRITPSLVKRVNVGGISMTDQLTKRLQLLHPEHSPVLTTARVELLKEKVCYVSEEYNVELNRIRKDPDYFNAVTKTVMVPTGEGADKPAMTPEEQARLKQARSENGRRLSEMMKRRAKANGKDKDVSGTEGEMEDSSYTPEEVQDLYDAMKKLYDVKRIEDMRDIDEDKYYIAMCVGQYESSTALNSEIDKRQLVVDEERAKLTVPKAQAAEGAWWKRIREDELLSMSDTELSAPELKRKRHVRALRGAAEARLRAKRAKLAEKAEAERRAEEIRKMREERPNEYLAKLRSERDELAERLKRRDAAREAGSDRRSQAARERMRLLAQHAGYKAGVDEEPSRGSSKGRGRGRGKGRGRGRGRGQGRGRGKKRSEEDTFGMNDSDWDVYRSMKVGNDGTDSEDNSGEERARLKAVRDEIMQMAPDDIDPTMTIPVGSALLYEENRYADEFPVTIDRIRTPELMFQPMLAGVEQCGIIEALQMSAASRSSIVREVFLTGGVANTGGLKRRICTELRKVFPSDWGDDIVSGVRTAKDPVLDAWRGAAKFAEMGGEVFGKACITKAEYEEMGNGYLKEHSFGNVFYPTPILSAADLELKKKMQKQASKRGRPKSLVLG